MKFSIVYSLNSQRGRNKKICKTPQKLKFSNISERKIYPCNDEEYICIGGERIEAARAEEFRIARL